MKTISNCPSYSITVDGDIWSEKRNKYLKKTIGKGYLRVTLYDNNVRKTFLVHRLIALAFLPNPENKKSLNHINGNGLDNRLENLEWCTQKENVIHAYKTGLKKPASGANSPRSKKVIDIKTNEIFGSCKEASISCNFSASYLSAMMLGRVLNKTNLIYYNQK